MAECNEVITKVVYNYDGEHESSNADSEEKSALQTLQTLWTLSLTQKNNKGTNNS